MIIILDFSSVHDHDHLSFLQFHLVHSHTSFRGGGCSTTVRLESTRKMEKREILWQMFVIAINFWLFNCSTMQLMNRQC